MPFDIDNIRSGDRRALSRAEQFLIENQDDGIRVRPKDELERAMETGQGLLITRGNEICGVSLIYKFDIPPNGPVYSEMGSMRVVANGYGLQVFLAKFHLLQIRLEEYSSEIPKVFAVVSPGSRSAENLQNKVQMMPWDPTSELAALRGALGVPFSDSKQTLIASEIAFQNALSDLRNWHQSENAFQTPIGNDRVRVQVGWFSSGVLTSEI